MTLTSAISTWTSFPILRFEPMRIWRAMKISAIAARLHKVACDAEEMAARDDDLDFLDGTITA